MLFEGPKTELKDLSDLVRSQMQNAVKFCVPMDVSMKAGPNWLDMEEIKRGKGVEGVKG